MPIARPIQRFRVIQGTKPKALSGSGRVGLIRLASLVLAAVSMAAGLAHLFTLPNKIHLPRDEYFTVQQIYRGWARFGIVLVAAWAGSIWSTLLTRRVRSEMRPSAAAAICLTVSLLLFLAFTLPANLATRNWTFAPANWEQLRAQWEYSHALAASLDFTAFLSLALSLGGAPNRPRLAG